MNTVAVEFLVLVDRSHRDIHGLLRCLLVRLRDGPNGRSDEMIPVGEGIRTGLVIFGRIDNSVGLIVILDDIKDSLHGITLFLQAPDLLIDPGHGKEHFCDIPWRLFHVFG